MLKAFLLGFVISSVIIVAFLLFANSFGLDFRMGFPLWLIERRDSLTGFVVYISWFIPFIVGLVFAFFDFLSML
ncbi:MAG: hypothetical protein J7L23_05380 [Candidatus Diapherotrites archaeon]|nr:hypothetical protein [Candidatus Diapherotrites archaeon]